MPAGALAKLALVSAGDYWPFAVGIRRARREWWMRVQREGFSAEEMTAAVSEIRPRLAAGPLRRAELERLDLPRFRDEGGGELLDLPRAPLPPAETPAPVRFLPTWDATLLVHARGTGILRWRSSRDRRRPRRPRRPGRGTEARSAADLAPSPPGGGRGYRRS